MLIKDHCLLFIYQKNAMRIDSRKDITVVLSRWFPDFFGGKSLLSSGHLPPFVVSLTT